MKIKFILFIGILVLSCICRIKVYGGENSNNIIYDTEKDGINDYGDLDYYDFDEIEDVLEQMECGMDFDETVKKFMSGDTEGSLKELGQAVINGMFKELAAQKTLIFRIILIGIVAALFSNIAKAFLSGSISDTGFYITYILLLGTLSAGYGVLASMITEAIKSLLELMEAIIPVFILSIGFASGQSSAMAFYQVVVIIIIFIEKILLSVIVPLIYIFMIANLINNITGENFLTKACELLKTAINWILKALLSIVIGINVVQSMLSPVVDSIKTSTLGKAASVIPGIGQVLNSVSGIILGAGSLIKNAIGMAAMVAIVSVCFVPVIKTVIISIAYKAAGAILEPVSDKRIIQAINGIYESMVLLGKTLLYAIVFFLLTVAIICSATNFKS